MSQLELWVEKENFPISNIGTLQSALTHRSHEGSEMGRFAFVGEQVVRMGVAKRIYMSSHDARSKLHNLSIHLLASIRSSALSRDHLADAAVAKGIPSLILVGKGREKELDSNQKILAEAIRAVVGAVAIDQNVDTACEIAGEWVIGDLEKDAETFADSASGAQIIAEIVRHRAQLKYGRGNLTFVELDQANRILHDRELMMQLSLNGQFLGVGKGKTKKIARKRALCNALLGHKQES